MTAADRENGFHERLTGLKLFTNIPSPYNRHFCAALRDQGLELSVAFESAPSHAGRAWPVEPEERPQIAQGIVAEVRGLVGSHARPGTEPVVLSGNYATPYDLARRVGAVGSRQPVWFWGERLGEGNRWLHAYRRLYFTGLTGVLAIGTWAVPGYRAVAGRSTPIHVFPYTTSARIFPDRRLTDEPTLGFVGQLVERKGLDRLIAGLALMPARRRPVLEVVGSGPLEARLRNRCIGAGVRAVWHGEVRPDRVDDLRSRWWVQAVPSRYDGWGLVVPEAMAVGIPVLASAGVGSALDLIRPGFNGELVEDQNGWPGAIAGYLDRDAVLRSGDAARRVGVAFSADRAACWLRDLLSQDGVTEERSFVADAWREIDSAS